MKDVTLDFEALFQFWINTGLHINDFIAGVDLPEFVHIFRDWPKKLKDLIRENGPPPDIWLETIRARPTGDTKVGDINIEVFQRKIPSNVDLAIVETNLPEIKYKNITAKIIQWREKNFN